MKKVAITTTSFAKSDTRPMEMLKEEGLEIVVNDLGRKLSKDETVSLCNGCVAILAGTENYGRDVLMKLAGLKVISRCGVGLESIDLKAANEMGIEVINTPFGPTTAVAELTVALILDLLRKVSFMDRTVRSGGWEKIMGSLLSGKNVGIIGFGRIGEKVAALLEPFGCKIMYTDITRGAVKNFRNVPLTELLKKSDIVSIHVSSKETLISEKELMAMKKSALIVNMSRGEVVDESALYRALKDGHIGGAALDVFNEEPYGGPLKYLDNVVLTPHVGSYALEARIGMEIESVENLLKSLKGVK